MWHEITDRTPPRRGFGSYVLPMKRAVREQSGLEAGDLVRARLTVLDADA